ncbi:hypothetical protein CASFOL_000537 [Castilleja foliolosa]|uniref:RNase H type-1 domain-containing protein n=1 Tax=Castilleja foliolosa TaxID=1961234 RepID=A0ABD3ESD2_9LAMI
MIDLVLVDSVTSQTKEQWKITALKATVRPPLSRPWKLPPFGCYKVNTDASFSNGMATAGVIIKNHNGSILAASTNHSSCDDPITAEAIAILLGCNLLDKLNIHKAVINAIADLTLPAVLNS